MFHAFGQGIPLFFQVRATDLVEGVKYGSVADLFAGMDVVGIGCPHEIMHIRGEEAPGEFGGCRAFHRQAGRLVAMADLLRVLEIACSSDDIAAVDRDVHGEVAPYSVEFTGDIGRRVPAFVIVFAEFRVPLGHAETHAFCIVTAASTDLHGHLCFEIQVQHHFRSGQYRFIEDDLQDGLMLFKLLGLPVHFEGGHTLIADLIGF